MTDITIIDTQSADGIALNFSLATQLQNASRVAAEHARGWNESLKLGPDPVLNADFYRTSAATCERAAVNYKINAERNVFAAWTKGAMSKSSDSARPFYKRAVEQRVASLIESDETETASALLLKLMTGTAGVSAQQALLRIGNKLICENDDVLPHITGTRNYYRPYRLKMQRDAYAMQQRFDFVKSVTIKHGVALLRTSDAEMTRRENLRSAVQWDAIAARAAAAGDVRRAQHARLYAAQMRELAQLSE